MERTVAIVVGPSHGLAPTIASIGVADVWFATPRPSGLVEAAGLAKTRVLDPWPGDAHAAGFLAREIAATRRNASVALLRSGTLLRRSAIARAESMIRQGCDIVELDERRAWAQRIRLSTFRRAGMQIGFGVVLSARAIDLLMWSGWPGEDGSVTVGDERVYGRVRCAPASLRRSPAAPAGPRPTVTVVIPARDEATHLGETLDAVHAQSLLPDEIIVVDDGSTDGTGDIARARGARVVRSPRPTGSKASAANLGLRHVTTEACMVLDADTTLHPEALYHLVEDLRSGFDATSGACLPREPRSLWSRARAIEYATAMRVHKPVQRALGTLVVMSGCISLYRTDTLRGLGGFSERTLAEDIDLTWALQIGGRKPGYNPRALSYPAEPDSWALYRAQIRRWASGFFQAVRIHGFRIRKAPGLALTIVAALWDLIALPVLLGLIAWSIANGTVPTQALALWAGFLIIPFASAGTVIGWRAAVRHFPAYLVVSMLNAYFYFEALVVEWVIRRPRVAWVKGH